MAGKNPIVMFSIDFTSSMIDDADKEIDKLEKNCNDSSKSFDTVTVNTALLKKVIKLTKDLHKHINS